MTLAIAGGCDSVIYTSNLAFDNEVGKQKDTFKVENPLEPYDKKYHETIYEHDSIVNCIQTSQFSKDKFVSASYDSTIISWQLTESEIKYTDCVNAIEHRQTGRARTPGVTKVQWMGADSLVYSMANGTIGMRDLKEKDAKSKVLKSVDSKIWDLSLME